MPVRAFAIRNFNPRSPHGERLLPPRGRLVHPDFNPRSPHGERLSRGRLQVLVLAFQSTLPARGATADWAVRRIAELISIHAPRTGSDKSRRVR